MNSVRTGKGLTLLPIRPETAVTDCLELAQSDNDPASERREKGPTTRDAILTSLHARLHSLAASVLRDEVLPERIPPSGLIILRHGQPGEPEVTMSPLRYHYQHRAELEVVVQSSSGRPAAFDTMITTIGSTLIADPTLGGLCDWVEPEAPVPVDLPVEGAAAIKAAVITVVLHYTTASSLA